VEKRNTASVNWMYAVVLVVALAVFVVGVLLAVQEGSQRNWVMLGAGCVGLLLVLCTWPLAIAQSAAHEAISKRAEESMAVMSERLQAMTVILNEVHEAELLSDRAKSVAYREKDRDALRRAIREDIAKRDWEGALVLANEMESLFGYRQEAMKFREEVYKHQEEVFRRQINEGIAVIERHCKGEAWSDALREAERLMNTFKGDPQVVTLPQEIENRRQNHKAQLMASFQDALNRKDNDGAISLLKKLDLYLTRAEADAMQDTVRNLFKEKINDLRTQFALAVQDHKWGEAVRLGEIIVRDFPNSGIAREVREKLDTLRQRATEPETAAV
jgi:Skp family chaperone for outer membrane proteins